MGKTQTDDQLLRGALQGRREDFGILTERYYRLVYGVAFSYTGNPNDAEDLSQESFLRAYRSLDTLRDIGRFRAWLTRIVRNECHNWLARRKHERMLTTTENTGHEAVVSDVEKKDLFEFLWREIDGLDEFSREILTVYYFHGKNTREVAQRLDISVSAAEKRLQRARQILGERLTSRLDDALQPHQPNSEAAQRLSKAVIAIPVVWDGGKVSAALGVGHAASNLFSSVVVWVVLASLMSLISLMVYTKLSKNSTAAVSPAGNPQSITAQSAESTRVNTGVPDRADDADAGRDRVASSAHARPDFVVHVTAEGPENQPIEDARVSVIALQNEARTEVTDRFGAASFDKAPLGYLGVIVTHKKYLKQRLTHMLYARGGTLDVVLTPGSQVSGRVVDSVTGDPIPAFELELLNYELWNSKPWADGPVSFEDSEGRFSISNVSEIRKIAAQAQGYARIEVEPSQSTDGHDIEIALPRPILIEGRVTNRGGKAIVGAQVGFARYARRHSEQDLIDRNLSDNDGRFSVPLTNQHFPYLVAEHEGYVTYIEAIPNSSPPSARIWRDIKLAKTASVRGIVRYDGNPYKGAEVDAGPFYPSASTTNAVGEFVIDGIEPGVTTVVATLPESPIGYGIANSSGQLIELHEGQEQYVEFDFDPATSAIVGAIVLEGDPVEEYRSRVRIEITGPSGTYRKEVYVRADELYAFEGIPSGPAQISVEVDITGGVRLYRSMNLDIPSAQEVLQDIVLPLSTSSVTGYVQGIQSDRSAQVWLLNGSHESAGSQFQATYAGLQTMDTDGAFSFNYVEPGSYTLLVTATHRVTSAPAMGGGRSRPSKWFDLTRPYDLHMTQLWHLDQYPLVSMVNVDIQAGQIAEVDIQL